jgi:hypothetical protein
MRLCYLPFESRWETRLPNSQPTIMTFDEALPAGSPPGKATGLKIAPSVGAPNPALYTGTHYCRKICASFGIYVPEGGLPANNTIVVWGAKNKANGTDKAPYAGLYVRFRNVDAEAGTYQFQTTLYADDGLTGIESQVNDTVMEVGRWYKCDLWANGGDAGAGVSVELTITADDETTSTKQVVGKDAGDEYFCGFYVGLNPTTTGTVYIDEIEVRDDAAPETYTPGVHWLELTELDSGGGAKLLAVADKAATLVTVEFCEYSATPAWDKHATLVSTSDDDRCWRFALAGLTAGDWLYRVNITTDGVTASQTAYLDSVFGFHVPAAGEDFGVLLGSDIQEDGSGWYSYPKCRDWLAENENIGKPIAWVDTGDLLEIRLGQGFVAHAAQAITAEYVAAFNLLGMRSALMLSCCMWRVYAPGNHDHTDLLAGEDHSLIADISSASAETGNAYLQRLRLGDWEFFAIDSNHADFSQAELDAFESAYQASSAPRKCVVEHHPFVGEEDTGEDTHDAGFYALLVELQPELLACGHEHMAGIYQQDGVTMLICGRLRGTEGTSGHLDYTPDDPDPTAMEGTCLPGGTTVATGFAYMLSKSRGFELSIYQYSAVATTPALSLLMRKTVAA